MALSDNNLKKSTDNRNSRYVQGGISEIYSIRTGWWERQIFERQDDDIQFVVGASDAKRPDIISQIVYGKAIYAWLVLQYNNIVDVETELLPGKVLFLPSQSRLILDIITKPTGGKKI